MTHCLRKKTSFPFFFTWNLLLETSSRVELEFASFFPYRERKVARGSLNPSSLVCSKNFYFVARRSLRDIGGVRLWYTVYRS